jgi:hypothetical protein
VHVLERGAERSLAVHPDVRVADGGDADEGHPALTARRCARRARG